MLIASFGFWEDAEASGEWFSLRRRVCCLGAFGSWAGKILGKSSFKVESLLRKVNIGSFRGFGFIEFRN